mgnify:CR=1 FL=1
MISKESYTELYNKTFENLLAGNCYQLNLTSQLKFKIEDVDILEKSFSSAQIFDHLCEFAHLVNLPLQDRLIISNSPECLYEYSREDKKLVTRPIKGTVRVEQGADAFKNDIKNESELNIITDLLRNDLSRIGENFSIVEAQKEIFEVPGLIHQYSKISVECHDFNSVKVLKSIYPGGSITGAPKKRVLKLINSIEKGTRGIYTGSTVVNLHNINKASINIRTLVVSKSSNHAVYGAGGGITLLSSAHGEYFELLDKANSFLKVFFKDVKL